MKKNKLFNEKIEVINKDGEKVVLSFELLLLNAYKASQSKLTINKFWYLNRVQLEEQWQSIKIAIKKQAEQNLINRVAEQIKKDESNEKI